MYFKSSSKIAVKAIGLDTKISRVSKNTYFFKGPTRSSIRKYMTLYYHGGLNQACMKIKYLINFS